LRDDRALLLWGLVSLVVLAPAAGWGIPLATSEVTVRGWEVDAISGIGVLSEISNLAGAGRSDWYVAYPLFHYLLLAVVYAPYLAYATFTGALSAPGSAFPYGFADPVSAFTVLNLVGHAISVAMACVTVMAVFVLARRLFGPRMAALAAGIALFSAPFQFYARTGNLDVPALCWSVLALVFLDRSWSNGLTVGRAIACGSFAALAVATKDQAYGLLLVPLGLVFARSVRDTTVTGAARARAATALVVSGIVVYLVAAGVILSPDRFVRHIDYITSFRETFTNVRNPTELTVMRGTSLGGRVLLLGDFLRATSVAIGWPALVVGLAGLAISWRTVPATRWMAAALAGYFVLVLMPIEHMQYRYALAPALILGISATGVVARVSHSRVVAGAFGLALLVPAGAGSAEVTHAMLTDARRPASRWLREHAAAGDVIGFFGRPHQLPLIPAGVRAQALHDGADPRERLLAVQPRWVVVAPDYFADPGRERSIFLPAQVYDGLRNGSLGWRLAARFESKGLLRRPLPYLPYVNPVVQVYERRAAP
jgi:4-amino-4-deoxy-L-arabinose transferase-like glycosyltransferase